MSEHFELLDIYKAIIALIAGMILGFEREMKDKSAGLKTITVICLGSALFSIISYKLAGPGDPTRIASYIVSGIGFLGAGVIFKSGFNVYGLTTAGIIWIAAAIGMAIGFGEVYIAFTFLISALLIIYSANYITKHYLPQNHNKNLKLILPTELFHKKAGIIENIRKISKGLNETGFEKKEEMLHITLDLQINTNCLAELETYLVTNKDINSFSY
ncbi:MgtC/SapB family protein [Chryseobacterium sp. MP_3.2]|uniref:MgtC/SapB family protein n=1 Tax=Chryseobacterium sp. MP_3.2 TaxID=3071712 RepID=UPI002E0C74BA|nr:putative Mg2+ transporter-C (MgtC) family protein [Chryseobacterium sp. MP_3.2]